MDFVCCIISSLVHEGLNLLSWLNIKAQLILLTTFFPITHSFFHLVQWKHAQKVSSDFPISGPSHMWCLICPMGLHYVFPRVHYSHVWNRSIGVPDLNLSWLFSIQSNNREGMSVGLRRFFKCFLYHLAKSPVDVNACLAQIAPLELINGLPERPSSCLS